MCSVRSQWPLTFDYTHSNQFIFESKWMFVPKLKKFHRCQFLRCPIHKNGTQWGHSSLDLWPLTSDQQNIISSSFCARFEEIPSTISWGITLTRMRPTDNPENPKNETLTNNERKKKLEMKTNQNFPKITHFIFSRLNNIPSLQPQNA